MVVAWLHSAPFSASGQDVKNRVIVDLASVAQSSVDRELETHALSVEQASLLTPRFGAVIELRRTGCTEIYFGWEHYSSSGLSALKTIHDSCRNNT
eukprot:6202653-Pleurochrysis_carterae.AAC.3